jgi:hypothetical protein
MVAAVSDPWSQCRIRAGVDSSGSWKWTAMCSFCTMWVMGDLTIQQFKNLATKQWRRTRKPKAIFPSPGGSAAGRGHPRRWVSVHYRARSHDANRPPSRWPCPVRHPALLRHTANCTIVRCDPNDRDPTDRDLLRSSFRLLPRTIQGDGEDFPRLTSCDVL